jgi:uncharacterized protein YlzI (FlbEa/FlbD family)
VAIGFHFDDEERELPPIGAAYHDDSGRYSWDNLPPLGAPIHSDVDYMPNFGSNLPGIKKYEEPSGAEVWEGYRTLKNIRLYVFRPIGLVGGPYFVVAESEQDAVSKIAAYLKATHLCAKEFIKDVNSHEYKIETYRIGEVALCEG